MLRMPSRCLLWTVKLSNSWQIETSGQTGSRTSLSWPGYASGRDLKEVCHEKVHVNSISWLIRPDPDKQQRYWWMDTDSCHCIPFMTEVSAEDDQIWSSKDIHLTHFIQGLNTLYDPTKYMKKNIYFETHKRKNIRKLDFSVNSEC